MKMYLKAVSQKDDILFGKIFLDAVSKALANVVSVNKVIKRLFTETDVYVEDENNIRYCIVEFVDTADLDKEVIKNEWWII